MAVKCIEIALLRRVCNQVLQFIEDDLKISSIELDNSLYWTLPDEDRFDVSKTPRLENVGDLADDYEFVEAAGKDLDQAVPLLLEHIAPILGALANRLDSFR